MPQKPRTHFNPGTKGRSLKSRVDSRRYGAEWRRLRDEFIALNPVCHCNAFRYWDDALGVYGVNHTLEATRIASEAIIAPAVLVDHIRPLSMGGSHDWDNLQSLCGPCHAKKTNRWG